MYENGWTGPPGFPPAQVVPGPSNPWAAKTGGGRGGGGGGGGPGLPMPSFPPPQEGGLRWPTTDEALIVGGSAIVISGVSLVGLGGVLVGLGIAGSAPVWGIGAGLAVIGLGVAAVLGGIGAIIAGIDPPVRKYADAVVPRPSRPLTAPKDAPSFQPLLDLAERLETLTTAEIDMINRARSAAAAKDEAAYKRQVNDLYKVQGWIQVTLRALSDGLGKLDPQISGLLEKVDPSDAPNHRDLAMILTDHRDALEAMGFSPAELNMVIGFLVIPSPTLDVVRTEYEARKPGFRTGTELIGRIAADLGSLDMMTWEAFGGKPAT